MHSLYTVKPLKAIIHEDTKQCAADENFNLRISCVYTRIALEPN